MSQQLMQSEKNTWGKGQVLAAVLAGDVAAATLSATAISPILTVIDRSVVENAAPANQPLLSTLRTNILNSVRRPRLLFATKPFLYMWTLYAATYTTANAVESIGTALTAGADRILISSITFISTCLVNVPLGVWKDVRFVQTYGRSVEQVKFSKMVGNTRAVASPTRSTSTARATRSSRTVAATFLFRDAITIFGSISLPPMLSSAVSAPDPLVPDPSTKNAAIQIFTPVLSQEMVFDHKNESANHHTSDKFVDAKAIAAHDTDIEAWRAGTLRTLDLISEGDILALKTTGGGPAVSMAFSKGELPPQQMLDALDEIATKCKERNVQIIVDAESQHWQKGIARTSLELMRKFNRDGKAVIYNTYQAYLKDTSDVLAYHMAEAERDGFTLGLKLVRGAYILSDNRSLIHDTKEDTDNAYNTIAQGALRQQIGMFGASGPSARPFPSVNLFLASHNRESVLSAHRLYRQRLEAGLPTVPVAYGQLHGMSDEVSFSLLAEKSGNGKAPEVLKCTTWGSMGECVGYLLRRAVENRDAVLRTKDEFTALRKEVKRRFFWA
ncbi:unnamed protein product [Alternaria alternata]